MIINTLMSSLFVYKMTVLPHLSQRQLAEIDSIIRDFLWKGKKSRISLKLLHNPKELGGLALTDFRVRQVALHLSWIQRILYNEDNEVYSWLIQGLDKDIWNVNLNTKHMDCLIKIDSFWKDIAKEWAAYHYTCKFRGEEVKQEILWFNSNIVWDKLPFCNMRAFVNGLRTFSDVIDINGNYIKLQEIHVKFGDNLDRLEYEQLKKAIPKEWRKLVMNGENCKTKTILDIVDQNPRKNKVSKNIYQFIIEQEANEHVKPKWKKYCQLVNLGTTMEEFLKYFEYMYKITKDSKLISFQYRQLIFALPTNRELKKWGI